VPFLFLIFNIPRDTGFNLLYLDFSFSEIGVRSAFHRFTSFAHTLALQVFKLGFWDENLVLHPKLNAQRGSLRGRRSTW